jgi:hypothetical protein
LYRAPERSDNLSDLRSVAWPRRSEAGDVPARFAMLDLRPGVLGLRG